MFFQELAPQDSSGYMDIGKMMFPLSQGQLPPGPFNQFYSHSWTPARSLLHLLCLRFVPEGSRRRCPSFGRAAQVKLSSTSPGLVTSPHRVGGSSLGIGGCGGEKEKRKGLATGTRRERWGLTSRPLLSCYPTAERAVRWLPGPLGITRRCRAIRASSSRSLKRSRSCWPLKRQYR